MQNAQNLTRHPEILEITDRIRQNTSEGKYLVSDLIVREGGREYQFVDLVMEGGGTLGIALVGYIHALEQADIRFLGMGGSSVGAIVALLAYGCGERLEPKGEKLADIIGNMNLGDLVDGGFIARKLSRLLGENKARLRAVRAFFELLLSLPELITKLGLNPGDKLFNWISEQLGENGIETLEDLEKLTGKLPKGLLYRGTKTNIINFDASLKIVAADVTTSTKVTFPEMTEMYWKNRAAVNPASFARASASIPGFFQPYALRGVKDIIGQGEMWEKTGGFKGNPPDTVMFADGGLLSNFPIDLFKRRGRALAPTFGVRLGDKKRSATEIKKVSHYATGIINALMQYSIYDFIYKNPLYNHLIEHINVDQFNWLDFNMGEGDKFKLFKEGALAAEKFLDKFDWQGYKSLREAEYNLYRAQKMMEKNSEDDADAAGAL